MIDSRQKIEAFFSALSNSEPEALIQVRSHTEQFGVAARMNVGHYLGVFLELITKSHKANRVLEVGTFTGYSTICFARGVPADGKIVTLDKDAKSSAVAKEVVQKFNLSPKIDFVLGDALESMKAIAEKVESGSEKPFDIVFIDADKKRYPQYWEQAFRLTRPGSLLLADNVFKDGGAIEPKDDGDLAIKNFNEFVSKDIRVDKVFVPIRDGLLYAIRKI